MKVTIGEIIGEEGLLAASGAGPAEEARGGFIGLQFLCFPSMAVVMGEEEEEAATATQELLAAVAPGTQPSAPSPGSSVGAGGGQERRPVRELMTAHAAKAYVRASFDLAIKGLMLGDVQKRTQASVKRFTESLKPTPNSSSSSPSPQLSPPSASGVGPGSPAPLPPALSPLRKGMAMHLSVDVMQVELVLSNPAPGQAAVEGEEEGPTTFMAILVEMKVRRISLCAWSTTSHIHSTKSNVPPTTHHTNRPPA